MVTDKIESKLSTTSPGVKYRDGAAVTQSLFFSKMSPTSQSTKRRIASK